MQLLKVDVPGFMLMVICVLLATACSSATAEKSPETPPPHEKSVREACVELSPEDPYTIDPEAVEQGLRACRTEAVSNPDDGEIAYKLGAAELALDHHQEALDSFRNAERLGECKALYFLGDIAWYSEHNEEQAEDYYTRGAECGDKRAAREIFSADTYAASAYPKYISALYRGDIEELNHVRFVAASYVVGLYEGLKEQYLSTKMDPCWKATHFSGGETLFKLHAAEKGDGNLVSGWIYEKAMPVVARAAFPSQGSVALEEMRSAAREAGAADLIRMVQASECKALLPYKILKGVKTFASSPRSLLEVAQEAIPGIQSVDDLRNLILRGETNATR